jgi:hypothetical protein
MYNTRTLKKIIAGGLLSVGLAAGLGLTAGTAQAAWPDSHSTTSLVPRGPPGPDRQHG